jgi:hypothetical protein
MPRTKDAAGANEAADIAAIIEAIKSGSPAGIKITEAFKTAFGHEIVDARERSGGSRSTHYDFEVLVQYRPTVRIWRRIEHKGSAQFKPPQLSSNEKPWSAGVQFHNGGCEKYSIAKKYARGWYDMYVATGAIKSQFQLTAPIPSFEEWFDKDCKTQGPPKTAYGIEQKEKVRAVRGGKSSLLDERGPLLAKLEFTDEDKELFKAEVLPVVTEALEQKDYWLTIYGDVTGEFYAAWYPKLTVSKINDVIIRKNKDVEFEFRCDELVFHGILRWGMGAGFSNIRVDLK